MTLNGIRINNSTVIKTGILYDISEANRGETYTDLADALGTDGSNVPESIRNGGMSVCYIQTADNKYVQWRYTLNSINNINFCDVGNWVGVDEEPVNGSKNLVESGGVSEILNTKVDCNFDDSLADLNIGDEEGEVIAQFKDGHIKTKNFDSRETGNVSSVYDNSSADFNIGDEDGNVVAQFKEGHIKTLNFDSRDINTINFDDSTADLNIGDETGEVIALFKDGHIKTKNFDSRNAGDSNSFINVKSYGAVGDSSHDDTQAIQTALNECGLILIPSGTYKITQPLVFRSNTHIIMAPDAELKQYTPSTRCVIRCFSTKNDTSYNGVHDVIIEGGILNANDVSSQQSCSCLAMIHCKNITLRNLTFKGVGVGMHCVDMAASKDVLFDRCVCRDNETVRSWGCCFQIDGANSNTSYPYLSLINVSDSDPIYDDCGCMNIEIKGCQFYLNNYSPAIGNHNYSIHEYINIHDNMIYGCGVSVGTHDRGAIAFDMYSGYVGKVNLTDKVFIHHNFITDCPYGFSLDPNSNGSIYIRDNYFVNVGTVLKVQASCAKLLNNIQ